ncbi:YjiH family protein [Vaginisenegalia massiliensis]|uniref:YjiH family protein n=1 Tax=Vaginisenegalia massiliensis TaxID=2058294 RepID=UPI000F521515|nr:YjiH family protein [Vaginisenegalia massiliensis]
MQERKISQSNAIFRFICYSLIGIFMFFIPIKIGELDSIPLDHLVGWVLKIPSFDRIYGAILVVAGAMLPFVTRSWKKSSVSAFFAIIQLLAIPFLIMYLFQIGPKQLLTEDMIPFIFNKIVTPVTTIVPIGSVFLAFIVSYGLMEFIGVFMRPVMVPIFKTPGRSAVDAVASFVGSYSLALLLTNRVYKEGRYTHKEAAIIATGFSTVSATFMVIVAKTVGLMDRWLLYFNTTIFVTFLVTALVARLYPLRSKKESYYQDQEGDVEQDTKGSYFAKAWQEALSVASQAPGLLKNVVLNLKDGLLMATRIAPSLMSIGVLALILAKYTPIFDWLGLLFYPVTLLMQLPEPLLTAKAAGLSIAEMFLPALMVAKGPEASRYVIAIVSISEILFFSASIPCMMATDIPLKFKDYLIIWFERVVLSIIIATPLVYWLF